LDLPCKLNIKKDGKDLIQNIKYESVESAKSYMIRIQSFIDIFPNSINVALNAYFKDLRALIKQQKL
jgi:hypothetical protein